MGGACGTLGRVDEFTPDVGGKTWPKERHERLSLIWEDNIEMGLTGTEW